MQPTTSCSSVIRHPGFNSQWLLAFNYFTSYNDTYVTQQTKKKVATAWFQVSQNMEAFFAPPDYVQISAWEDQQ